MGPRLRSSPLPPGRQPVVPEDAPNYILKLSKTEHEATEWRPAMEALISDASGGPTMLVRISLRRASNRRMDSALFSIFCPRRRSIEVREHQQYIPKKQCVTAQLFVSQPRLRFDGNIRTARVAH